MRSQEQELKLQLEKMLAYKVRKLVHSNAVGIYECQLHTLFFVRNGSNIIQNCRTKPSLCSGMFF